MPKGIIVLDGPDGVGKTTMAKTLVKQYGAKYLHLTYRWKNKMDLYHLAAINFAEKHSKDSLVVIDRWWMSEACYTRAYRSPPTWPLLGHQLDRIGLSNNLLYIVCLPVNIRGHIDSYDHLKETRDELYSDILPVVVEYHKLWDQVQNWPNVIRYDYTTQGANDGADYAKQAIAKLAELSQDTGLSKSDNLLGNINTADFLFLYPETRRPIRDDILSPGSRHVAKALKDLNIPEYRVMHSNYGYSNKEADELLVKYSIETIVFGEGILGKLFANHGSGQKAWLTLGHPLLVIAPDYDLKLRGGRQLRPQLGKALLTAEIHGKLC